MARVLGAATPLVPSAHPPVPHYPKPIRRQSPWYDDPASAASRASRHQGPPVHLQHHPSSGDRVVQQGYGGIPLPVTQDTGRQRRNIGSRPGMHNRPRMHIPAAAGSRLAEQPAVSSKSGCERAESHSEVSIDVVVLLLPVKCFFSCLQRYSWRLLGTIGQNKRSSASAKIVWLSTNSHTLQLAMSEGALAAARGCIVDIEYALLQDTVLFIFLS